MCDSQHRLNYHTSASFLFVFLPVPKGLIQKDLLSMIIVDCVLLITELELFNDWVLDIGYNCELDYVTHQSDIISFINNLH